MPRTKLILITVAILSVFVVLPAIACHKNNMPHGQTICPDPPPPDPTLEELDERVSTLETKVDTLESNVGTTDISGLETQGADHESRITVLEQPGYTIVPFDISLNDDGSEEVIVTSTNGDLSVFVRCEIYPPQSDVVRVQIVFDSTADNWFAVNGRHSLGEQVAGAGSNGGDSPAYFSGPSLWGGLPSALGASALSAAGDFTIFISDIAVGVNILGSDCIAKGIVTTFP